jgi:hypothetical protein
MLHEFVTSNRNELIKRCRDKAAMRHDPFVARVAAGHGVPRFLLQLADTLRAERLANNADMAAPAVTPPAPEIGRAAALHGAEMLSLGFTVGQVVNEYGDVCQSIMDLAIEKNVIVSADEFRTFNRCLDQAIADAVTAFGLARQSLDKARASSLGLTLDAYVEEHRRLVDIAIQAYFAVQEGHVGSSGATGNLLVNTLTVLRGLADRNFPEIRLASAAAPPATVSFATTQI